jgi:protein involved in polysaccharide export with SLBB domain
MNDIAFTRLAIIMKRAFQTSLLIISFVAVYACSSSVQNTRTTALSPDIQAGPLIEPEYRINVGDDLDIKFFYNPELNERNMRHLSHLRL